MGIRKTFILLKKLILCSLTFLFFICCSIKTLSCFFHTLFYLYIHFIYTISRIVYIDKHNETERERVRDYISYRCCMNFLYDCDNNLPSYSLLFSNLIHFYIVCIFFSLLFQTPEDCSSGTDCLPMIISWEGSVDIQSGDVLIVEIDDKLLISTDKRNKTNDEM